MTPSVARFDATSPSDLAAVRALMHEYAALPHVDGRWPTRDHDLAQLPAPFVPPHGMLVLAARDSRPLGCGGIVQRPPPGVAEIKRLYVRPEARGLGLGRALMVSLLHEADRLGCHTVRLDTAPELTAARALYASFGFDEIPPFRDGLSADALCFERAVHPIPAR